MRILIVDDDAISREMMASFLGEMTGYQIAECSSGDEALQRHHLEPFDLVLADVRMPGLSGVGLLREIKAGPTASQTDVILMTGYADVEMAVAALREGAADFLRKPINIDQLVESIQSLVTQRSLLKERTAGEQPPTSSTEPATLDSPREPETGSSVRLSDGRIVGLHSRAMRAAHAAALRYHDDRDMVVLIEGETGTGKELMARLLHEGPSGSTQPFLSVNCAALPDALVESELFGYVPGAFTGASQAGAEGKLRAASGGSLVLDEIGELPLPAQAKLLRALQEREIYPVGSSTAVPIDVRIIASTNRILEELVTAGQFRSDLFYRIALGRIHLPPLRRQRAAIVPLAQQILIQASERRERNFRKIHPDAARLLEQQEWPGNVRQLDNVIRHAVLLYNDRELLPEHLTHLIDGRSAARNAAPTLDPEHFSLPEAGLDLPQLQLRIVRQALDRCQGNVSRAAELLGLSRSQMRTFVAHLERDDDFPS